MTFHLGLSLSVCGPREGLLHRAEWPMALRITVGYGDEPAEADAAAALLKTLPWHIWTGQLELALFSDTGKELGRVKPILLPEEGPFVKGLRAAVEAKGLALLKTKPGITLQFQPKNTEVVDGDDQKPEALPWPGLLATLNTLAQPTPSALMSTWIFNVPRVFLFDDKPSGEAFPRCKGLLAAPTLVDGEALDRVDIDADGNKTILYANDKAVGHCDLLDMEKAMEITLDELDNYWMTIRDSREDSLLDIAHRIDDALAGEKMIGAFQRDELIDEAEIFDSESPQKKFRKPLAKEMPDAIKAWKACLPSDPKEIRTIRNGLIEKSIRQGDEPGVAVRAHYEAKVVELLELLKANAKTGVFLRVGAPKELAKKLTDRLLKTFKSPKALPCQPNEGIQLAVGNDLYRLVHEDSPPDAPVDEVAGIQLFGRRSTRPELLADAPSLAGAPWHALTGAAYAIPVAGKEVKASERVPGLTAAYLDGVLYREVAYYGSNLICANALEKVHASRMDHSSEMLQSGPDLMFSKLDRVAGTGWSMKAVPLRYGDHYEFAASIIDRAGGQASEMCGATPWEIDLNKVPVMAPPQKTSVHFLRRVPLGSCNVVPAVSETSKKTGHADWPSTPDDVWLRCLEQHGQSELGQRPTSVFLVPQGGEFSMPGKKLAAPAPLRSAIQFTVEPPTVDEHTFLRWMVPATDASETEMKANLAALKTTLGAIHKERGEALATGKKFKPGLPFDPAVTCIGLRWKFDGEGEKESRRFLPATPRGISVSAGAANHFPDTGDIIATVAEGRYLRLGIVALVEVDDYKRFDDEALSHLVEDEIWEDKPGKRTFMAFRETVVYFETATADMPTLPVDLFKLAPDKSGNVQLFYECSKLDAGQKKLLDHVHQMRISSQRWVWRNLPIPPRDVASVKPGDWTRRIASGLPASIMDPAARDVDPEIQDYYDKISELDDGFVARADYVGRFPRTLKDDVALHVDARENITGADYLRYRLSLSSRYKGVLRKPEIEAIGPRRIAVGFRGDDSRIKPLKILAVMPLTTAMVTLPEPMKDETEKSASNPFLVIVDELWNREYGPGERLGARIAHVKAEIEDEGVPPELRFGPLPDHSVTPRTDIVTGEPLDVFGPFGFSMDRSQNQARANATGFVVYPPKNTPPHYNLFLEFERILDLPTSRKMSGGVLALPRSKPNDAVPVYTLPDSARLHAVKLGAKGPFILKKKGSQDFTYDSKALDLQPFEGAAGEVLTQYRYIMIVGRMVRDGGRAVDVFLPEELLWIQDGRGQWLGTGSAKEWRAAVVGEVLLNGRYPLHATIGEDAHPLKNAPSLKEFFKMLLRDPGNDAPAMIRRFSAPFVIAVHD